MLVFLLPFTCCWDATCRWGKPAGYGGTAWPRERLCRELQASMKGIACSNSSKTATIDHQGDVQAACKRKMLACR